MTEQAADRTVTVLDALEEVLDKTPEEVSSPASTPSPRTFL